MTADGVTCLINFGANGYEAGSGTYGSTTSSTWATLNSAGWRYRVRKVSNGNMAEVPPVVRAEYAGISAVSIGSSSPIVYTTKVDDTHSGYNTSNGEYTVPVSGVYQIDASVLLITGGAFSATNVVFTVTGGTKVRQIFYSSAVVNQTYLGISGNCSLRLYTGDKITLTLGQDSGSNKNLAGGVNYSYIDITRIGS